MKDWIIQHKRISIAVIVLFIGIYIYWNALPKVLFDDPTSTVLNDSNGRLLGARIASDEQWRFPYNDSIPNRFEKSIIAFEDRNFYNHIGVSPKAILRAIQQNVEAGEIVSGASTLSMQVIRLSRKGKKRTYIEKIIEIILATRLELKYSKHEILALYSSNAPFGGNVVGLDAASWRYLGRSAKQLSWAESATLAVLPNAPGLIYPGRNPSHLKEKRDRLLRQLFNQGTIDETSLKLALLEPLPGKPYSIPSEGLHLLNRAAKEGYNGQNIQSTLDGYLQSRVANILSRHHKQLKTNQIFNACAIVVEIETGQVKAYLGNTRNKEKEHGSQNDVIVASRSTGSILKPFLFAQMLTDGCITPDALIADIPTQMGGFVPQNYNKKYDGAVPASEALSRSLNIPAVRMLRDYGIEKFHYNLKKSGLTTLNNPPNHYGMSIILGGAEGKLWDIVNVYRKMALQLRKYPEVPNFHGIKYTSESNSVEKELPINVASIWHTFEAMQRVSRPEEVGNWEYFNNHQKVAWKTGTSFGFRDAWALGVTSTHVVGVWVGNADGEGRPGLTGIASAGPILFDIVDLLPKEKWFDPPYDEMKSVSICKHSGSRSSQFCFDTLSQWIPKSALKTKACTYCKNITVDQTEKYRVNSICESIHQMKVKPWFVLTPVMEWYYKKNHQEYKTLPPYRTDCIDGSLEFPMRVIYPKKSSILYLPKDFDGNSSKVVFEVSHRQSNSVIHWHFDEEYVGSTNNIHQMEFQPEPGKHILTLTDQNGQVYSQEINVKIDE